MTREEIQQMIVSTLNGFTNAQQFGVSKVPFHTHNGVDSSLVSYADVLNAPQLYGGSVLSTGVAGSFFPSTWSVAHTATGRYTITHNLGTTSYSIVANNQSTTYVCSIVSLSANTVEIDIYNSTTLTDSAFNFILLAQS